MHKWRVTERYPDGGVWHHYFYSLEAAESAIEDLKDAHKSRIYELEMVVINDV